MQRFELNGHGIWVIRCEPQVHTRFKRVFQRVSKSSHNGTIQITDTPENCRELEWFMQRYPLRVRQQDYLTKRARDYDRQLELVADIMAGRLAPRAIQLAKPAYPAQLVGAELAMRRGRLLVADELGAGKTITSLCMIANQEARPALVVTLTDLPPQWVERIIEFTPGLTYHILKRGTPFATQPRPPHKYGPVDLAKQLDGGLLPPPDIIISNYTKLAGWAEWLLSIGIKSVTFDEIQELRSGAGTNKYDAAIRIARGVPYAMGLSATPIYNYGAEVYNVVTALEPDAFGSPGEFYREWCATMSNGKLGIGEPDTLGRYLREQGYMIRRTVSEVTGKEIDKPLSFVHKIEANLAALDKMATDAADLARIIVSQAGHSNQEKFRAAGEFDYKLRHATGVAKAPTVAAFAKILLQSEDKLLMFAWHHDVYAIFKQSLADYRPVFFNGRESQPARQQAKKEFVEGDARIMIISLRAGAGMDGLQKGCRVVLFAELDWSPRIHDQCVGRLARPGQDHEVLAYYPICEHGSDPVMVDALGVKNMLSHGILDPDAPVAEPLQASGSNIKSLAAQYLANMGEPPETADAAGEEKSA